MCKIYANRESKALCYAIVCLTDPDAYLDGQGAIVARVRDPNALRQDIAQYVSFGLWRVVDK